MTRGQRLTRRDLLRTATGALFLAPLIRQRRLLAQTTFPRRLVLAFTPDSHPPEWWPVPGGGGGAGFTLGEPLADFAGLEPQMLFVRRLDQAWTADNHHDAGMVQLFTGQRFFNGTQRSADGPSIDQILLRRTDLRGGTPIASVHLSAAGGGGADKRRAISYSGPGQPMAHEEDPTRAFASLFGGVTFGGAGAGEGSGGAPPPPADPVAATRQKVRENLIKVSTAQVKRLQGYLGREERTKLDLHVEALFELERQVKGTGRGTGPPVVVGGRCEPVITADAGGSVSNAAAIARQARTQIDLIVNAFTCDRTRVADFGMSHSGAHHEGLFGRGASWHDSVAHLSRTGDSIAVGTESMSSRAAYIKFDRFFAGHVAYLARRLSEITEGDGTMLDHTLIVWGAECGTNHNHGPQDMQFLLAGGRRLGIRTGQMLNVGVASANKLLVSILNAFGHPAAGIGVEPTCGPLPGVL